MLFFSESFIVIVLGIWWCLDAYFVQAYVRDINQSLGVSSSGFNVSTQGSSKDLDKLEKLHSLFEKGAITKEEFEAEKAKLL